MKFETCRWLSICISPHLDAIVTSLSEKINDFVFLFHSSDQGLMRRDIGWKQKTLYIAKEYRTEDNKDLLAADLYIDNLRRLDVLEERAKDGKMSVYMGERWFKPPWGFVRMIVPSYIRMARRFFDVFKKGKLLLFPSGIHAVRDMLRILRFFNGDITSIFFTPKVAFESRPGGRIYNLRKAYQLGLLSKKEFETGKRNGFVQIPKEKWNEEKYSNSEKNVFLGGYVVEFPTRENNLRRLSAIKYGTEKRPFRILWAGRMLDWKRVDVLISAVRHLMDMNYHVSLLIVGQGPEREKLLSSAKSYKKILNDDFYKMVNDELYVSWDSLFSDKTILFSPYLKNTVIQKMMCEAIDLYVMPSDGGEGWGAVVSEAVLAKCPILSTFEAGSSATLLSSELLYRAKSVSMLRRKLESLSFSPSVNMADMWMGKKYAHEILKLAKG